MTFLLDTNVVSEAARPRPAPSVLDWLAKVDEDRVFLSVVSLAEIRRGIERLPPGPRRNGLEAWLQEDLPLRFEGRLLGIDASVADAWGRIVARREDSGRPIGTMDAFIAATAAAHSLILVTRNVRDFEASLPSILNPWDG